ncbi:MAG: hypothetical protein R6V49_04375 [Bacteroidales bacterium]
MKKLLSVLCAFTVSMTLLYGQAVITVQSGSVSTFYTNLDSAVNNAPGGSTIYLPGGTFTPAGNALLISKPLNIIGAGHYPDSSLATGVTILNGHFYLLSGADGGSLQGVRVNNHVFFGQNAANCVINGYQFSRCYFNGPFLMVFDTYYYNPTSQNILLSENVFKDWIHVGQVKNVLFSQNIFTSYVSITNGQVVFRNNIFLLDAQSPCPSTQLFHEIHGATFYDNIFNNNGCYGLVAGGFTGNSFYNNIFSSALTALPGNSIGTNNLFGVPVDSIYVSHTYQTFDYNNDYRLKANCVGKNAGSDSTDIGLYGTAYPYKPAAVQINPHIISRSVAPSTDAQGHLPVNIKVSAQDR